MSDVSPVSGISGLSFDSTLLFPLLFFCQVLLPFLSFSALSEWCLVRVVSCQGGLLSGWSLVWWSLVRMVSCLGGLLSGGLLSG